MERYDQLYRLYEAFDAEAVRTLQNFVDVFPPVDSRAALDYWEDATDDLESKKAEIRRAFPRDGDALADVAAHASREQAFTALDLLTKYGRDVNVLVLDVDETLRSAGSTDNEIPRDTLNLLTEFHEAGVPIVVCTGQTLENVKGFMIQGLGNELVHSGDLSVVYETGTGVFTPGHGPETKKLLYEDLDPEIRDAFGRMRSGVLSDAPEGIREGCHLQGNEFNVTLKPNFETGRPTAREVIDDALVYLLDLLGETVVEVGVDDASVAAPAGPGELARAFYAERDPEIRSVLDARDARPDLDADAVPPGAQEVFERIDVAYYEADAAEVTSLELNKVVGVEAAFEVLGVDDPFALVMGDSKSDLRVMEYVERTNAGIAAAPEHASTDVLDHVRSTDDLVFDHGDAADSLRVAYALRRLAAASGDVDHED